MKDSSISMNSSAGSSGDGKAIKINPDELVFENIYLNQIQTQQLQMRNNLSAPVEINLKSSNIERFDIEPKTRKLAPFETFNLEVTVKFLKPFAQKTQKHKEQIFIKSDFFDQKVNVILIPAPNMQLGGTSGLLTGGSTTPRDNSLNNSSNRGANSFQFNRQQNKNSTRDKDNSSSINLKNQQSSLERTKSFDRQNNQQYDEEQEKSSPKFKSLKSQASQKKRSGAGHLSFGGGSGQSTLVLNQLERDLQESHENLQELSQQLRKQEIQNSNTLALLQQEQSKRQDLEEQLKKYTSGLNSNENEQLLKQLMELTLKKERDQQERKDAKILEILKIKDRQIEELQARVVTQEAEYGKLAQAYQEQKRAIREHEERQNTLVTESRQMQERNDLMQSQLESFQRGREYQRMLEMEEQLQKANEYIQTCQQELLKCQTDLQEKSQVESFFDEAVQRYKDQLKQHDITISKLQIDLQSEKELRQREEERLQTALNQLNQINNTSIQERDLQNQFLKQEREYIDKINQLQQDKQMLLEEIQNFRDEKQEDNSLFSELNERMMSILKIGKNNDKVANKTKGKSPTILLESNVEELIRALRDVEKENEDLTSKNSKLTLQIKQINQQFDLITEERDHLLEKTQKKVRTQGRSIQTSIELEDMELFGDQKQRHDKLVEQNIGLQRYTQDLEIKLQRFEHELDGKNQELMFLVKNQSHHNKNSFTTISDINNQSQQQNPYNQPEKSLDEIVSRLNSKITQMKMNEEQLVSEIKNLNNQLLNINQPSSQQNNLQSSSLNINKSSMYSQQVAEERISEYEIIMLEQRQQLIKLADENVKLKLDIKEGRAALEQEREEMRIRLKNMNELKEKHEQINQLLSSQQSDGGYFGGQSNKSTAVETERMRQYVQTLELNQMQLKHQSEELKTTLNHVQTELHNYKEQLFSSEQVVNRLRSDLQMARANNGLISFGAGHQNLEDSNNSSVQYQNNEGSNNKLIQKVIDQRGKIRQLQGFLIRAKQDMDQIMKSPTSQPAHGKLSGNEQTTTLSHLKSEEVFKTNDKLRKEHQSAILALVDLREEYTSKLMIIAEKHEQQRTKLKQENLTLSKRLEHVQTQLSYMEKKEMRLYSQLEEARNLQEQESKEKDARTKELEELLFKKEEALNELEREVRSKEKTIQDRQEQIAVLIGTLENEHSAEETRQKLLNMTAEICSVKAIQAQTERRINELTHTLKKSELHNTKLSKLIEIEKQKGKEASQSLKRFEKSLEEYQRKYDDLRMQVEEREREVSELKFMIERQELQTQLKEESITQLRDQLARQDVLFKQEVDRVRNDLQQRLLHQHSGGAGTANHNVSMLKGSGNNDSFILQNTLNNQQQNMGLQLKTALSQLHIIVAEYLKCSNVSNEKQIVSEFEKVLQVSSVHIEKLQQELDKCLRVQTVFQSELKAGALNKVLVAQNEQLQIKLQKFSQIMMLREEQREEFVKQQQQKYNKLLREQELKLEILNKENNEMESDLVQAKDQVRQLKDQKEELESNLFMFDQEQQIKLQSLERKAELSIDERFKSKNELIKAYFDSNITRILLNTQNTTNDKIVEFGREIVSLKLVISSLHEHLDVQAQEIQALDLNLAHYKELNQSFEQRQRESQIQNNKLQNQLYQQDMKTKMEMERKKQEVMNLEKDLLRARDTIETKTRELIVLSEQLNQKEGNGKGARENINSKEMESIRQQLVEKEESNKQIYEQLQDLQEKLVESRTQHINELEDMRVQYDLELTEQKRNLQREKEQLERKFLPGQAPGDLLDSNQELQQRIIDLKTALDRLVQENCILRKKCENEKAHQESQRSELYGYKQALLELESTMIEMTTSTVGQSQLKEQMQQSVMMNKSQQQQPVEEKKKSKLISASNKKKANQLHFNRDMNNSESDQYSQSKINHQDQSSLNVSALTSVNMIQVNQLRPNSSLANYSTQAPFATNQQQPINTVQKNFLNNPPQLVKALIQAKINESLYKKKCEDLVQVEIDLRQQIKEQPIKLREYLQNQTQLQLTSQQQQFQLNSQRTQGFNNSQLHVQVNDYEFEEIRRRVIDLEIENEDLKLQRAQDQVQLLQVQQQHDITHIRGNEGGNAVNSSNLQVQDYNTLIESVIILIQQISNSNSQNELQSDSEALSVERAQQLVIRSLASKILSFTGGNLDSLNYVPTDDKDRKLWYLELLEQQVNTSEQVIQQLQQFIKKLQIDISGNLQSAAQIKAASMELAQNTMKTSEEVKTLRHIVGLIKHDLNRQLQQQQQHRENINTRTINPFEKNQTLSQFQPTNIFSSHPPVSQSQFDQLQNQLDSIQNQLTITEKVKKSLESELIQLKIQHQKEIQSISSKFEQTTDQRNSLLQTNEDLHSRVQQLQMSLEKLRGEISNVAEENQHNQTLILEKEKERQIMAQTKTATSKHLNKLQQDMKDWRAQTEDNIKVKEKQIGELQGQLSAIQSERDRLKSENQMLRRNEKDRKQNQNSDLQKVEQENKQLIDRLNREMEDRKREIEYWVTERATMRQMIDQLETDKIDSALAVSAGDNQVTRDSQSPKPIRDNKANKKDSLKERETADKKVKELKKKLQQKLKQKEVDLQLKERQIQDLHDDLSKLKIATIQLESRLREASFRQSEADEKVKYAGQKLKEVELERDLVLAERNNALQSNDISSQQIQQELNSLRECFVKLKVERDSLLYEIESSGNKESEWRQTVDRLNQELQGMEKNLLSRDREQSESIRVLESKNSALLSDVKYLKLENEKLKDKGKQLDQSQINFEQQVHKEQIKNQEFSFQFEDQKRQINELRHSLKSKDQSIEEGQAQLLLVESQKMKDISLLKEKIDEIKEANAQIITLYENQLQDLRQRFAQDKKRTEQQLDNMFSLAQRDAVVKSLKKELATAKQQLTKSKQKTKDLKTQIQNQENVQQNNSKVSNINRRSGFSSKHNFKQENANLVEQAELYDKKILKLAQMLLTEDSQNQAQSGFKDLLEQMQKSNQILLESVELRAELEKTINWNLVISQQLSEQNERNQELLGQIDEMQQRIQNKESNKMQRSQQASNESIQKYKQEIKQLQGEIDTIKDEWLQPSEVKILNEKLKDFQAQIKSLKDEVQRKREVITQLKAQQNQTEVEANQILTDMEGLKDDNVKLQKLIRENQKNMAQVKDLKGQNDYLKTQEKRLKEEINQLQDKLKGVKVDLQRKEQLLKEHKDKLDQIGEEVSLSAQRQNEIERLKEMTKKLKLETEIKDNQVKALKQRLEHNEEEIENLKTLAQSQSMVNVSQNSQLEQQIKVTKNKIKKYEVYLKKSLDAIKKIGKELSHQSSRTNHIRSRSQLKQSQKGKKNDSAMEISEFERDFYKDSVNILGVSMDELEEFMNPTQASGIPNSEAQQFIAKLERVSDIPDTLNQDIDQICTYCVRLIQEINPDIEFK